MRGGDDREEIVKVFSTLATQLSMRVQDRQIRLTDRTVMLSFGTPEQMSQSIELLDCVAELRLAKERPEFFMALSAHEQAGWIDELRSRTQHADGDAPSVCILDTGVNNGHPLLTDSLDDTDLLTCDPDWGGADHEGHTAQTIY